ncbi:hypothetical protein DPMN_042809 [Dreissena polymorpha]|uniref:Uncharacterized protein n=1 Tax=Dreissena polymorpha TaxID=45954 RepID=A0A9D4CZA1_DREPO|nr:hypothetical protein DPMN_042809 [Dreissena polymorpha]
MHPKSKISIVFPAKILADGRVVADMFPDWSQVLNGDRITTNGNYSHQSLSLKPHQYEVNHKSVYGDETSIPHATQHNYSPNSNYSPKSLSSKS